MNTRPEKRLINTKATAAAAAKETGT